ncbi:aldehyde ferredoxin oxidoreductase, partial [Eggerthella sp. NSJ-70]
DDLYQAGAKIMTLQRANTVRGMTKDDGTMGENDMRNVHDVITEWAFTKDPDLQPFAEGTDKMDRDDFQTALGMVYDTFGWDHEKGCPTAACLDRYGMADVKDDLQSLGLLP